ncbi:hypothetical protein SAMN04515665_12750 [Blastococcus sp. DSM 46786]|uniref:hypothetical protein n=1 Tax=Blastococcus sp. DSM 46786 TaxID=1798227 RepID=UPI0008D6E76A|nr:hypothetical protein [Blastococcus sp. DSM 46786]SEM04462.1 hypothetical protein SAMN04515665_12750 [Blastococcus sp. DSM 46786]
MTRATRPHLLRRTAAAFAITAASLTTVACGEDVVDDSVEQNIQEGVDEVEQEVDDVTEPEGGNG